MELPRPLVLTEQGYFHPYFSRQVPKDLERPRPEGTILPLLWGVGGGAGPGSGRCGVLRDPAEPRWPYINAEPSRVLSLLVSESMAGNREGGQESACIGWGCPGGGCSGSGDWEAGSKEGELGSGIGGGGRGNIVVHAPPRSIFLSVSSPAQHPRDCPCLCNTICTPSWAHRAAPARLCQPLGSLCATRLLWCASLFPTAGPLHVLFSLPGVRFPRKAHDLLLLATLLSVQRLQGSPNHSL